MASPVYAYGGTLVLDRRLFDQWLQTFLPSGPFYAFGIPEWLDLQTFKVPYNARSDAQPDMPVQVELWPTE